MSDLVVVGAGLAGSLLAARLLEEKPELSIRVLEKSVQPGGVHTWSFHETDLSPEMYRWISSWIDKTWQGYEVWFPQYRRIFNSRYCSIRSESFAEKARERLGKRLECGKAVEEIKDIKAKTVLDARGDRPSDPKRNGYQKFVGWDLRLKNPHGLTRPILMDVTCEQLDGFRFFYLLPWDEYTLLVEDTRYSDTPEVDPEHFKSEIRNYCEKKGWEIAEWVRCEIGSLPIPFNRDCTQTPYDFGARAGLFHPTTGYSLPYLARVLEKSSGYQKREQFRPIRFFFWLNRLLFLAAQPEKRYLVLQRFYRFPEKLIQRFYSGQLSFLDGLYIICGKPPVPILAAVRALLRTHRSC